MCAGDLGMYRVMPWAYPPISGGTSGGFSPDGSTSEGGGSGGGSSDPNAIYVKIEGSSLYFGSNMRAYNETDAKRRVFNVNAYVGQLGLQNINDVITIDAIIVIEEVYLNTDPTKNEIGSFTTTEYRITNMPVSDSVTRYVTGTTKGSDAYFYRPIQDDSTITKLVGSVEFVGYDSGGNVVRTNTIPMEVYGS